MTAHTIHRFTFFSAVQTRICLVKINYFNVRIYCPPRYQNFITHRAFVFKLPIFQYFYWNHFFNLNFCNIVFSCARNCTVSYMNHIYDSIQRIFWNHLTHRLYDFFQECHRRVFFHNILYSFNSREV